MFLEERSGIENKQSSAYKQVSKQLKKQTTMRNLALVIGLLICSSHVFGQRIPNPSIRKSEVPYCKVKSIEISQEKTIVNFNYAAPEIYANGGWVCVGDNFFLRDNETGKKYFLIKANNIPVCPQKYTFSRQGESLIFSLEFQPIPKTCKEIDIIESLSDVGFNFYGVNLSGNRKVAIYSASNSNEAIQYSLSLATEGKLKNKGNFLGDILYKIPAGASVGVYSKDKGYYKVNHSGNIGYLSELYFNENNKSSKQNTNTAKKNITNKKEIKSYYKNGKTFQYYIHNGISVTMHLSIEKNYGKYYIAYVAIENLTGKAFNFNPNNIRSILTKKGEEFSGEVLSSNEYIRKVNNRQAWNAALVAFGESSAASQAGYSSSSTTSTTSGYSNSYGSASGYYGNTYGSISGTSSTYGTATTHSNTQSYSGAANYAAQQNAQRNINNYQNQQYQIKNVLNQGYLKLNTIDNEQRIVGQINIKYKSADKIKITIPVNGVNYDFWWNNN